MWGNSGVMTGRHGQFVAYNLADKRLGFRTMRMASKRSQFVKFSGPVLVEFPSYSRRSAFRGPSIRMTLVDERLTVKRTIVKPADVLAYDLVQGANVSLRRDVVDALAQEGFSKDVAQWVVTNLRQIGSPSSSSSRFSWIFDLNGISEMYKSYEETNMWRIVEDVPRGVHVNFLKAERSLHRWALEDLQRIHAAEEQAVEEGGGVEMHVLEDAGHWVHADNPDGLFKILSFSFQGF